MKVHIGRDWRPSWFERRHRDGTYEAFNAPQWPESIRLQGELLGGGLGDLNAFDRQFWTRWLAYGAALLLSAGSAVMLLA